MIDLDALEARCQAAIASENSGKRFIPATEEEIRLLVYELESLPALIAEVRRLHVQNLNLRAAIEQIMPRYVELFAAAGLGDPSESVAVQIARDVMAQPE